MSFFETINITDSVVVILYFCITAFLGWLGWRHTKDSTDYLVAGRRTHPFIMAMSYGATFISTSAIVGFGGVAAMYGMSILWLVFLNIFVGILIAFVFLGGRTRRMSHLLNAQTFPELIGKRFQSRFIQVFAGAVIFLFMPLYAAAVLIGGAEFMSVAFGIDYNTALFFLGTIVALYVVYGGLKGVMYTDAFQGTIMVVGMLLLLGSIYWNFGGLIEANRQLSSLSDLLPQSLREIGHQGWTSMPKFGFGDKSYDLWWIMVTTIILGVGIGVLAQPQLLVRFMTVKSKKELNRGIVYGSIFILIIPGSAYLVGAMSNVYFSKHGGLLSGAVVKYTNEEWTHAFIWLTQKGTNGVWSTVNNVDGKPKQVPVVIVGSQAVGMVQINGSEVPVVQGRSISITYAGDVDRIIPEYVTKAMPKWFWLFFLLTLLSAAMSTLSGLFHAIGTSAGHDIYIGFRSDSEAGGRTNTLAVVRIGIIIGILMAIMIAWFARGDAIIARATAIFYGLCSAAFLPTLIGGLFFRRMTKAAAVSSMIVGSLVSIFWLLFVKAKEAGAIGLVQIITGGAPSILWNHPNWPVVDPVVVALPLSALTAVIVSCFTKPLDEEHLRLCFPED
jgi:SSS family solute:Na+ symporter